jgi:two-component system, NarL family, nitrate/nitrite response regulator NarL
MALRVLIVDDSADFLAAARALLEREGICVAGVASTAADALREADQLAPQLILVDITLAEESGFELARRLTETNGDGERAVVLVSTRAEADFAELIAESPARAFLSKSDLSGDALRQIADRVSPR